MSDYTRMIIDRGGGIVTCGECLGVFVSHPDNIKQTPAGWTFVDVTTATEARLDEAIANCKQGRATWPEKEQPQKAQRASQPHS